MSEFIPNSFQVPNTYIDLFMAYLNANEFKVLMYAIRRILGFRENLSSRTDRISLSQFSEGVVAKDGRILDEGTGLSKPAVKTALDELVKYGFLIVLEPATPTSAPLYQLQTDVSGVDAAGLMERKTAAHEAGKQRMSAARQARPDGKGVGVFSGTEQGYSVGLNTLDDEKRGVVFSGTEQGYSVGLKGGVQSDCIGVFSGTETQYTSLNTVKTQLEKSDAVSAKGSTLLCADEVWNRLKTTLRAQVEGAAFERWVAPLAPVSWDGVTLTLSAAGPELARTAMLRMGPVMQQFLRLYGSGTEPVKISIHAALPEQGMPADLWERISGEVRAGLPGSEHWLSGLKLVSLHDKRLVIGAGNPAALRDAQVRIGGALQAAAAKIAPGVEIGYQVVRL